MPIPRPQENLREVIRRAFDTIDDADPPEVARRAGGSARGRTVEVELLGRRLSADLDAREIRDDSGEPAGDRPASVVARYLALAGRLPGGPQGEVGFADITDARGYLEPFRGRVVAPLVSRFGRDPGAFARVAESLGGERENSFEEAGAIAYRLPVFPRVELTFCLYPGDEELPAEAQVLFPRELFRAFSVEDAVAMAELASRALCGGLWAERPPPGPQTG